MYYAVLLVDSSLFYLHVLIIYIRVSRRLRAYIRNIWNEYIPTLSKKLDYVKLRLFRIKKFFKYYI